MPLNRRTISLVKTLGNSEALELATATKDSELSGRVCARDFSFLYHLRSNVFAESE